MGRVKAWGMSLLDDASLSLEPLTSLEQAPPRDQVDPWHLWDNDDKGDNRINFDTLMDRWEDV